MDADLKTKFGNDCSYLTLVVPGCMWSRPGGKVSDMQAADHWETVSAREAPGTHVVELA